MIANFESPPSRPARRSQYLKTLRPDLAQLVQEFIYMFAPDDDGGRAARHAACHIRAALYDMAGVDDDDGLRDHLERLRRASRRRCNNARSAWKPFAIYCAEFRNLRVARLPVVRRGRPKDQRSVQPQTI